MKPYRWTFFIILVSVSLLMNGCATTAKYQAKLQTWQGKNISDFVKAWGYPDREIQSYDGNTVYIYEFNDTINYPPMYNPGNTYISNNAGNSIVVTTPPTYTPAGTSQYNCTTWVEFNKSGIILNTAFRGNNCVSD